MEGHFNFFRRGSPEGSTFLPSLSTFLVQREHFAGCGETLYDGAPSSTAQMLSYIKPLWETLQEPRTWTTANVAIGMSLILWAKSGDNAAESFALGWSISAFAASFPSLFSSCWNFRSKRMIQADRGLAYSEGWQQHRKSMESFVQDAEAGRETPTEQAVQEAYAIYLEGLNRVQAGKHLPNL